MRFNQSLITLIDEADLVAFVRQYGKPPGAKAVPSPPAESAELMRDARQPGGLVRSCSMLVAVGIGHEGKRSVLGVGVSPSEAEVHWRDFLASLAARGLHGVSWWSATPTVG